MGRGKYRMLGIGGLVVQSIVAPMSAKSLEITSQPIDLVQEWRKQQSDETLESHDQVVSKLLMNDFVEDLDKIRHLANYEIEIRWTDLRTDTPLGQVNLVGDKASGDLRGIITYCFDDYYPQVAQLQFDTHQRYDLAYVKGLDLLDSLAFFQQPYFEQDFSQQIKKENIDDIILEGDKLTIGKLSANALDSLTLMPNFQKLQQANSQLLRTNQQNYYLKLEGIEVPPLLFEGQQFLNLNYRLNMTLQDEKSAKQVYAPIDMQWNQSLDLLEDSNFLAFNVEVYSNLTHSLLKPQNHLPSSITPSDFNKKMSLSSKGLTDKITKVEMSLDPDAQVYAILVEGMVENVDLNIFNEDSSKLSTNHVRMEYRIKPLAENKRRLQPLPASRLTSEELEYYLEQYWLDQ